MLGNICNFRSLLQWAPFIEIRYVLTRAICKNGSTMIIRIWKIWNHTLSFSLFLSLSLHPCLSICFSLSTSLALFLPVHLSLYNSISLSASIWVFTSLSASLSFLIEFVSIILKNLNFLFQLVLISYTISFIFVLLKISFRLKHLKEKQIAWFL